MNPEDKGILIWRAMLIKALDAAQYTSLHEREQQRGYPIGTTDVRRIDLKARWNLPQQYNSEDYKAHNEMVFDALQLRGFLYVDGMRIRPYLLEHLHAFDEMVFRSDLDFTFRPCPGKRPARAKKPVFGHPRPHRYYDRGLAIDGIHVDESRGLD